MAKDAKTKPAPLDQATWLAAIEEVLRDEAARLLGLFADATGWEPRLWGPTIVGFGRYVYRYESGHSGESLVVGFSLRKAEISIYGVAGGAEAEALLPKLGPHRMGKGCLYIKRLASVDDVVLRALIRAGVKDLSARWPVSPV